VKIDLKKIWWYVKEGAILTGSTALAFLPEILSQFKDYTVAAKLAVPVAIIWRGLKLRDRYVKDTLPEFATKVLDKVPDSITGVKGSKLPGGLAEGKND